MSNFKFKKSEFMDLNLNKKSLNEAIEDMDNNNPEGMGMMPMDAPPIDTPISQTSVEKIGMESNMDLLNAKGSNPGFLKLVSCLFHSATQVHIFHLQTNSFSEHKALNKYYDEIVELTDGLIETFQGKYDILTDYENFPLYNYEDNTQIVAYFNELLNKVGALRTSVSNDSYLQNEIDNVVSLITSTLYKLRFLN
jgi:hypothetical protein